MFGTTPLPSGLTVESKIYIPIIGLFRDAVRAAREVALRGCKSFEGLRTEPVAEGLLVHAHSEYSR